MLLKLPLPSSSSSSVRWFRGLCEPMAWVSTGSRSTKILPVGSSELPFEPSCGTFRSIHTQTWPYLITGAHQLISPVSSSRLPHYLVAKRTYARHTTTSGLTETLNPTEAAKRKAAGKGIEPAKILLMSETENISVTTLPDAEKVAKKKGLQLVEVKDVESHLHSDKKVYKLQSQAQHFGEDWKNRHESVPGISGDKKEKKKEDKTVLFKSKISAHDLEARVKQMNKLLEKGYPIRVFIGGTGSTGDPEFVFRGIQNSLTRASKIQQKKTSATDIRFQIVPMAVDPEGEAPQNPTGKSKASPKNKEQPQGPASTSSESPEGLT